MATNQTHERRRLASDVCLPDLLWRQVRAQPSATAVTGEQERLTYRELADRSGELAGHLRQLGVAPDQCVGLFLEPSIDLMVGVWGVLLSGGAYLPLSPDYPDERLRYMVEDSRTTVVLTQAKLRTRLAELATDETTIVTLDADLQPRPTTAPAGADPRRARTRPYHGVSPHHLAYVIYTSGSTGKPKGVMIEHRSIVSQLGWLASTYQLGPRRVVLQKTPMSFDAAQWEMLAPACGSRVVMGTPGLYRDPERLVDTIIEHSVTTLQCVPTLLQALLDTERLHQCTSLTQIFSGGEALSRSLALRCLEALPECAVVNLYGPTECTINSSAFTVDRTTIGAGPGTVPIGRPVRGTQYHILNERRRPVPTGEVGELYIGGVQLARGYLRRPDLTAERFVPNPFRAPHRNARLYRTGDLAYWNADRTAQFVGRTDNQVKLRGFRVELDEIRHAVEAHDWVRNAAVIVTNDPRTGYQNLVAFVELNPKEAALMDQGNHGAHHQSKQSRLQVRAQLANLGCREEHETSGKPVVDLPGATATVHQRLLAFARKTYRCYDGGPVRHADIIRLLSQPPAQAAAAARGPGELSLAELGEILRYFGPHISEERVLPKYAYASPGALNATQMYLEVNRVAGLRPGFYYFHPVRHQLILIGRRAGAATTTLRVHFIGKRRAIEPVYRNNIREVLEIETGHMVGLFDQVLPGYGLGITPLRYAPATTDRLDCADEDYYLGTFAIVPPDAAAPGEAVDLYVQAHPDRVADLAAGQYRYRDGALEWLAPDLVAKQHVIAINQQVYARSSFGVTMVSRAARPWLHYVSLGRTLQRLQHNDLNLGFMSSGYSSKTGHDLPAARRMDAILRQCGLASGPSYFAVGGRVSDEQVRSVGMNEDLVHMKGPAEMIRDDLAGLLPEFMVPNRVVVLDKLPLTANGKVDRAALDATVVPASRPGVAPRTRTEQQLAELWCGQLKLDQASGCDVSVRDDFFECGGNSLIAVGLVNRINRELGCALPVQVLFESPTIEQLALRVAHDDVRASSRLAPLHASGSGSPVFCWPGLGGYPMNLRLLAAEVALDRPLYGVQAHGINPGEAPYATIEQMAAADVQQIRRCQPVGPYALWGYSFGARLAFETAYQLERSGQVVEHLFLIAPGSPMLRAARQPAAGSGSRYRDPAYVTILYSVFARRVTGPALARCLRTTRDEDSFVAFVGQELANLDADLIRRIVTVVDQTYQFRYARWELARRRINAPITIFKARGDDVSFLEINSGRSAMIPTVVNLQADHYSMLQSPDVGELVSRIRQRLSVRGARAAA